MSKLAYHATSLFLVVLFVGAIYFSLSTLYIILAR
jgi:hypothetical protein